MTRSNRLTAALAVLLAGAAAQPAFAQSPGPRVSPFINLNQPFTSPGITYYGEIRPQLRYNAAIPQLQQQIATNQQALTTLETAPTAPTTGHPFGFQTQRRYFQTIGRPAPATTRPAITAPANLATRAAAATRRY